MRLPPSAGGSASTARRTAHREEQDGAESETGQEAASADQSGIERRSSPRRSHTQPPEQPAAKDTGKRPAPLRRLAVDASDQADEEDEAVPPPRLELEPVSPAPLRPVPPPDREYAVFELPSATDYEGIVEYDLVRTAGRQ